MASHPDFLTYFLPARFFFPMGILSRLARRKDGPRVGLER
jgi:hypothetical protein